MSMTLILTHVRNAIHNDFKVLPTAGAKLVLTETERDAKCREVTISMKGVSFSAQPVLINLDKRNEAGECIDTHPLFTDQPNLKSKCDYALICPVGEKIFVLMIDLKSNNVGGWLEQTFASEQFTRYVIANIDRANNLKIPFDIVYRHIVFTTHKTISSKRVTGNTVITYELEPTKQVYYTQMPCISKSDEGHFLKLLLR
jgi:hypothetical protein